MKLLLNKVSWGKKTIYGKGRTAVVEGGQTTSGAGSQSWSSPLQGSGSVSRLTSRAGMVGVMHQGTRKLLRPGNTWLYWVLSKETPRSHCMKLERQNQSCHGDSSVLEIPGTQDIHQLKLQT